MNSLKNGEGVPLLNFEGAPGILLLNFEGGPGSHFFTFKGVPDPGVLIPLLQHAIEISLQHGCSPGNFLYIFRTPFPKNTSGGLLLQLFRVNS